MPSKQGGGIFFHFPVWNAAGAAGALEPLVPEPSGGAAVPGVVDHESAVAVGGDPGLPAHLFDGADAVQHPLPGRPQLDLVDQPEELDPFPVKPFLGWFCLFAHCIFPTHRRGAEDAEIKILKRISRRNFFYTIMVLYGKTIFNLWFN